MSGVTSPDTSASPRPRTASITIASCECVTGSTEKATPDRSDCTIRCTGTPMVTDTWSKPHRVR
jgi:hypothetical protein